VDGLFALVRDCLRAEEPVALATVIELAPREGGEDEILPPLGAKLVVRPEADPMGSLGERNLDVVVTRDTRGALDGGHSVARHYGPHGEAGRTDVTVFIEVFAPPPRMLIFGAVDFTAALVRVAKALGYHVTVCDARPVFATSARFPEADEVVADWPHRHLAKVADRLGPGDAICVLTHDHKFDIPALVAALKTRVGYLGAMGSRSTHDGRVERLRAEGVDPDDIRRIMAPIGIDIGARTPEETAVSICAEIISLRSGVSAPSLRDGAGPIHRVAS
jgi:xanthine dehydrogenase accessory factor